MGILKRNLGRCCSNNPIPSNGSTLTPNPPVPPVCSLIVCIILHGFFYFKFRETSEQKQKKKPKIVSKMSIRSRKHARWHCSFSIANDTMLDSCIDEFTRIYDKSEFAQRAEIRVYQLHSAASQWRLRRDANSRQSFDLSRSELGHAHRRASLPLSHPIARSDETTRRRKGGGPAQRHRREIHPAGE